MPFAQLIAEKELLIKNLHAEIAERMKDHPEDIGYAQGKYRLTRGSKVSDSRCEQPFQDGGCGSLGGDFFNRQKDYADRWAAKNISPLYHAIDTHEKEMLILKEKNKLPLLRQQLVTAADEFHALSPNDPEFRQKQIDQQKSLYEKSVALDTLERKHNLFGNLPSVKRDPIIVTPEPITITHPAEIIHKPITIGSLDFDYTKLAIAGAAIVGILALIIWRFK